MTSCGPPKPTPKRGRWSDDEDRVLRKHYGQVRADVVADRLGRSLCSVYNRADTLGLTRSRLKHDDRVRETVREMNTRGCSDTEIAAHLQADRHAITGLRRSMGLPSNMRSPRVRAKISAGVSRQCERLGARNMAEVRANAWRAAARRLGWPEDLRLRHLQILHALYTRGPMTRRELADAIGMPWKGSRKSLCSNDPQGSYLAHLKHRGLVVSLGRIRKGKGLGRSTQVYSIPIHVQPQPQEAVHAA